MHVEDAQRFILEYLRDPRSTGGYPSYGYDVFLPNVIGEYLLRIEKAGTRDGTRARELSPTFYDAAWELCRRGICRPGVKLLNQQSSGDCDGYSLTATGRSWLAQGLPAADIIEPSRLSQLFSVLATKLGPSFLQRANEAAQCHSLGCYLAACALSGAASESILLAIAVAQTGDESAVLKTYQASQGRRKTIETVVASKSPAVATPFKASMSSLAYWRDEAAHGRPSNISEIEAHAAITQLLRLAQLTHDRWDELTT